MWYYQGVLLDITITTAGSLSQANHQQKAWHRLNSKQKQQGPSGNKNKNNNKNNNNQKLKKGAYYLSLLQQHYIV